MYVIIVGEILMFLISKLCYHKNVKKFLCNRYSSQTEKIKIYPLNLPLNKCILAQAMSKLENA